MKSWMTSAKLFLAAIAVCLLCACASPQEKFISNLEDLTEQIETKGSNYSSEDWEKVFGEFQSLLKQQEDIVFTSEQKEEIGQLEGRCIKAFTQAMGGQVKNALKDISSQFKGFFKGLSGADEETKDDIKESLQEVADGAKEAVDEVSEALKEIFE